MKRLAINETGLESLRFFGKVNASISHELKNILAIISETTGFLDDLVQLARQGKQFDLSILENSNKSIAEEIERGFHTIRQMNRFAHYVDDFETDIFVSDSLDLAVNLASFLSNAKPVRINKPDKEPVVTANPFLLMNFLYQTLIDLYDKGHAVEVSIEIEPAENDTVKLIFSGFNTLEVYTMPPALEDMRKMMGIKSKIAQNLKEMEILIPSII